MFRLSESGLLEPSYIEFSLDSISLFGKLCFAILDHFHLIRVVERRGQKVKCNNLTLLNVMLVVFGQVSEELLTIRLLMLQVTHI